ncbi:MAG: GWxTD domain-containing protein [Acidobacteriota bacterium]
MKKEFIYSILFLFCLSLVQGCAAYHKRKNLSPEKKEFFSKVRYIITKQERKIFLNLPESERDEFIKKFWEKRDPDPSTEENKFKEKYFNRIEMANQLFKEGSTPGWLQDRGRVFILLGSPDERNSYPRGIDFRGKPTEIWYYGFYPLVFVDYNWNSDYQLTPQSAKQIADINRAQTDEKSNIEKKDVVLDFNLTIQKTKQGLTVFLVKIPYKNLWFEEKDGIWNTTISISLEIFDESEKKILEKTDDYTISFSEENIDYKFREDYSIQIPASLKAGEYTITIELENKKDKNQASKTVKFIVK